MKMKKNTQQPINWKLTRRNDKDGKIYGHKWVNVIDLYLYHQWGKYISTFKGARYAFFSFKIDIRDVKQLRPHNVVSELVLQSLSM